ncbi:outer membrane beta-barrel protein [Aestuariibaculum lutulentum]|uniref:Porin family protein n=1 Tax=Aestuariibaculum lutulentum TaxID=2920935 RepID=A0ABS9RKB4_9FLAO|nr:outer membrane beta-barrel protein [Aestuariibaculum lutulentum]MCH4552941.1 porin family protein [Aestuariibaculum lutulentum]
MKKLLFIASLLVYGLTFSQEKEEPFVIKKGLWNIGGNVSLTKFKSKEPESFIPNRESFGFTISPKLGYFISDNWELGLGLGYGYYHYEHQNNMYHNYSNSYSVSPFVRKYFSLSKTLLFDSQFGVSYTKNYIRSENENGELSKDRESSLFVGLQPGFTYFLNPKFALKAKIGALGYSCSKREYNYTSDNLDEYKSESFSFSLSSSNIQFGIYYFF